MDDKSFNSVGKELRVFELEKNDLLQKYNELLNIPQTFEEKISAYMTAVLYEFKRLETRASLKKDKANPNLQSKENRAKFLLNYIAKIIKPEQMQEVAKVLIDAGCSELPHDADSIIKAMPIIQKLAKPTLEKIDLLKKEMQELYLKHNIPFLHISSADIQDGQINPSVEIENQPQNDFVTGVFATSNFDGMNLYIARAVAGGMRVTRDTVQYSQNPFEPVEMQSNPNAIKLAKEIFSYALDAEGFEPQLDFSETRDNKGFVIQFLDEWVKPTKEPLKILNKEAIKEVDSEPFLKRDTRYRGKNGEDISYRRAFANKFGIQLNNSRDEQQQELGKGD